MKTLAREPYSWWHGSRVTATWLCLSVLVATSPVNAEQVGSHLDVPAVGVTLQRHLAAGDAHNWQIELSSSEYVEIVFEPVGIALDDVEEWPHIRVSGPGGAVLYDSVEPHLTAHIDIGARAVVSFVAPTTGVHEIRVTPRRQAAQRLKYGLRLERRSPQGDSERSRLAVHRLWREGSRLFGRATREAMLAAVSKYEEALRLLEELDDEEGQALTLSTIGTVRYGLSDAANGRAAVSRARDIWLRLGDERDEGAALSDLGLLAYLAFDHAQARSHYEQALTQHRAAGDTLAEATTLVRLGWMEFAAGEIGRVIDLNRQATPLWRQVENIGGESVSQNDLGRAYAELGDATLALDAFRAALALRPLDIDPRGAAVTLTRVGQLHHSVSDWPSAFDALQQALTLARRANDTRSEASVLSGLGLTYSRVGDAEEAQRYLRLALTVARRVSHRTVEGNVLSGLGVEAYLRGDLTQSREHLAEALAVQSAISDVRGQAATLRMLASTQLALGHSREALESITQSLEKSQATGVKPSTLATLAAVHAALGDRALAGATYVRALERAQTVRARDQEAAVRTVYGRFLAEQGNLEEARDQLEQALVIHESLRGALVDPDQRMNYSSRSMTPYELYIDVLMQLDQRSPGSGFAEEAFRAAERSRSRGLLDLLAGSSVDLRRDVDRDLADRERSLRWQLNAKATVQTSLLMSAPASRRLATLEREIADLSRAWRETMTMIRRQSPAYAAITEPQPLAVSDVRALLDAHTVLLEIAPGDTRSWLFAVTSTGLETFPLPPRHALDGAARDLHRLLTAREPVRGETAESRERRVRSADRDLAERARTLSTMVIGPVAAKLRTDWQKRRLVVVAPGALEYVPLAMLPLPGDEDVRLVARHETVMLPSASTLPWLRRESIRPARGRNTVAVIADPVFGVDDPRVVRASSSEADGEVPNGPRGSLARLPFSRAEAQAVSSQAPSDGQLQATDFDASLDLITSGRLDDYRIIHFATHGVVDTTRPELSGLALSLVDREGRSRDGFLRLSTIYHLRLSADLVVLSACQSALGREVAGEGLVGLTRGFMHAGARRVVASLWQVSDAATADLMKHFYTNLLQRRLPAAAALRRAQQQTASDPRWAPPYFWAGFVLQGDWTP